MSLKISEKAHGSGLGDVSFITVGDKEYILTGGSGGEVFIR